MKYMIVLLLALFFDAEHRKKPLRFTPGSGKKQIENLIHTACCCPPARG